MAGLFTPRVATTAEYDAMPFCPVDMPQPQSLLRRLLTVVLYQETGLSQRDHLTVCDHIFDHFDGRRLAPSTVSHRAALAYEGLTGKRPVTSCLQCQKTGLAVLAIAINGQNGGGVYAARALELTNMEPLS